MQTGNAPRVVVDTNVLVSAALLADSVSARALERALEEFQVIQSGDTLAELVDVIMRPRFLRYLDEEKRLNFLYVLAQATEVIEVRTRVFDCSDPKDNKFLELAIDGNAWVIVSGDAHLRALHPFRSIDIVTPGEFLEAGATEESRRPT